MLRSALKVAMSRTGSGKISLAYQPTEALRRHELLAFQHYYRSWRDSGGGTGLVYLPADLLHE